MKEQLEGIREAAAAALSAVENGEALEAARVRFLGKKGELTAVLRGMGALAPEERPVVGQMANEVRAFVEGEIEKKRAELAKKAKEEKLKSEVIDVTMPGRRVNAGRLHPLNKVLEEVASIFTGMGFTVAEGPEIELDYYNFEALNTPADHPARDMQDTFYISDNILLRTQTSSVQIRAMEKSKPPIRMIAPGRVFRSDTADATHSPVFHQIEGLVVDRGITMADLKGTLEAFVKAFYGPDARIRLRPHHFPFTEPSAEVDASCFVCGGKGCNVCKGEGWIEILGAGMVHPNVLRCGGIDPEVYSGFAFGMGLERLTMIKYGIDDLRLFYENDLRFLKQF